MLLAESSRIGCHTSTILGPFEIIKNDVAEGVVFIDDHDCTNQVTVTGNVIIHANSGDKIYIRTHPTYSPIDGNVYSDINGSHDGDRKTFAVLTST
jgi:hypothetical protein